MRRKTYLKAKKVQTFVDVLRMTAYEIQSSRWSESLNLPTTLPVILSAVALPVVPKVEFNVVVTLYITILVFLSPGTCFKSTIRFQSKHIVMLGPLYTTPGCFLARVESPRRVTLLQSNVYKRLHENGSQAGSAPLAG